MITDEQVDFVEKQILESGITNQDLKDDLLDHMCCLIEIDIKKGLSFDQAYQKAFLQTSPNGYGEIQTETIFLLNYKKIMNMKRVTYIAGFVFSLCCSAGFLLKILHQPGANALFISGLMGMAFIFMPLLLINRFKGQVHTVLSERMKWILGSLSAVLIALGGVMKLTHTAGAAATLGLGFLLFGFGFLPFMFFRMYKSSIESL